MPSRPPPNRHVRPFRSGEHVVAKAAPTSSFEGPHVADDALTPVERAARDWRRQVLDDLGGLDTVSATGQDSSRTRRPVHQDDTDPCSQKLRRCVMTKTLTIASWACEDCRTLAEWIRDDHPDVVIWELGAAVRSRADGDPLCDRCHSRRQADEGIYRWILAAQGTTNPLACDRPLQIPRHKPRRGALSRARPCRADLPELLIPTIGAARRLQTQRRAVPAARPSWAHAPSRRCDRPRSIGLLIRWARSNYFPVQNSPGSA